MFVAEVKTFWRMGEWNKSIGLTAEVMNAAKGDIQSEACTRLANIFAKLNDAEQRSSIMAAIMAHPASAGLNICRPTLAQPRKIAPIPCHLEKGPCATSSILNCRKRIPKSPRPPRHALRLSA